MPIELLLSDLDRREAVLPDVLPDGSVPFVTPLVPPNPFVFHGGNQRDSLAIQNWAIIVPRKAVILATWVQSLADLRWAQSGQAVSRDRWIFPVDPGMSRAAAGVWRHEVLDRIRLERRPRYILILGDLDEVSLELQQELMTSAFVGRLCFKTDDGAPDREGYRAYCDKVCALERDRAWHDWRDDARFLFYADRAPGECSLQIAYTDLVRQSYSDAEADSDLPCAELLRFGHPGHPWQASDGDDAAAARSLLHWARDVHPSILLSVSHGAGVCDDRQRKLQGALMIHDARTGEREVWDHSRFADRSFLPGGFWFLKACFGAGTPATSVYAHWLEQLTNQDLVRANPSIALQYLARDGRGFLARLPQVALASPRGPLGVVSHVDLTWTFGFQNPIGDPEHPMASSGYSPYYDMLRMVAMGSRLGNALSSLSERANEVATHLVQLYDEHQQHSSDVQRYHALRAWLWMQYLDLSGYVLLGDPAAQVPTAGARIACEQDEMPRHHRRGNSAGVSDRAAFHQDPEAMATAVLRKLEGVGENLIASELGIATDLLREWETVYREAGLAAMRALCSTRTSHCGHLPNDESK